MGKLLKKGDIVNIDVTVIKDGCEIMTIREEEIASGRIQRLMRNL